MNDNECLFKQSIYRERKKAEKSNYLTACVHTEITGRIRTMRKHRKYFQIVNNISSFLGTSSVTKLSFASHQPMCISLILRKLYSTCIAQGPVHETMKQVETELVTQPVMQPHLSLLLLSILIKHAFVTHCIIFCH